MSHLGRIELLGRVQVSSAAAVQVRPRFRSRKTLLLLAYLACAPQQHHNRETLGELLWPETDLPLQRNRLRYEVCQLRKALGAESLISLNQQDLRLSPHLLSDVAEFQHRAGQALRLRERDKRLAALEEAIALYQGPFLPGHYEEWILTKRHQLSAIYQTLVEQLITDLQHDGQESSCQFWRLRLETDPLLA